MEKQAARDLEDALKHPAVRRVLNAIIEDSGIFSRPVPADATTLAFYEGRRSVGVDLRAMLELHQPGAFAQLQQEALALRQRQRIEETEE